MVKEKYWKNELKFHLKLQILIALFITLASYIHIPYGNSKAFAIYTVHFLLLHFSVFGFVYLLSIFRKVFLICFPVLFFILACFSFWAYTQDITISHGLIQAVFETKADIAVDIISLEFILFLSISGICLYFLLKQYNSIKNRRVNWFFILLALLGIGTFFIVENYKFGAFKRRLPYNVYFSIVDYFEKPKFQLKPVATDPITEQQDLDIVFILGESVRADHLPFNGYHRNTMPFLSKKENLISFKNIYTPLTYTGISVPQILTDKSILSKENSEPFTSLYSVLNKANFNTIWIGNQTLEKSYEDIVFTNDTIVLIDKFHSVLSFKKQKDLELLSHFYINNNTNKNRITTLHMIGSHWYYNSRVTDEFLIYKPITESKYLGSSSKEALINSYDNTIVYLDYFLNELIKKLKKSNKKTILIYLSDHGEVLGENGKWLHAQGNDASKNPAMFIWYSDQFKKEFPEKVSSLLEKKNDTIATDFLYHSILDLSEIRNFEYDKKESIFN